MELWNITYFQLREKQQILLPDFKAGLKKNYWFDHISTIGDWYNVHLNIPKYMVKTKPIIGRSNFGPPRLSLIEMLKTFKIHQVLTVWNTWHSVGFKSSSRPSCVTHPLASKKPLCCPLPRPNTFVLTSAKLNTGVSRWSMSPGPRWRKRPPKCLKFLKLSIKRGKRRWNQNKCDTA